MTLPAAAPVPASPAPHASFALRHAWLWFTLPALLWTIFIAWGSMAPPEDLPTISFPLADKLEHAGAYTVLGFLLLRAWLRHRPARLGAWGLIVIICALYGFYLECLQALSGYRDFELADALCNTLGATLGATLWFLITRPARQR
jgi:VanZ family protein